MGSSRCFARDGLYTNVEPLSISRNGLLWSTLVCKQDDKVHILDDAEKEVGKMLSENLVDKFRATTQYKDIIGLIFSAEASFPEPSRAGLGETPME